MPSHNTFHLPLPPSTTLTLSSDFDSGNLQLATITSNKLIITPAYDPIHPQYSLKQSSKTFFHFSISADKECIVGVVVTRMKILEYFSSVDSFQEMYRVCVGQKERNREMPTHYNKVKMPGMKRVDNQGSIQLHFNLQLKQNQTLFLAYHFPYNIEQHLSFIHKFKEDVQSINRVNPSSIYFANQLLTQSLEKRPIHLITLTQPSHMLEEQQSRISKSLFPFFEIQPRPKKFNKPYLMFTCRVHSGQTSSSYALQGLLQYLISQHPQAQLMRKSCVFLIIPMLNPDGIFHGTYRMDTQGHNLNRFYNSAVPHKQPAIFAAQSIASYYSNRLLFFMDMHSHPHPNKGAFIYGNSHSNIEEQTQSQLYARVLSNESQSFGYQWCNFSPNQMNSRDANQLLTKDGSARVQIYKMLNLPFIYTMQMGYHGCPLKTTQPFTRTTPVFQISDYKQHGKSIIIALFKMFHLTLNKQDPASTSLGIMRQEICKEIIEKQQRFRHADANVFKKIKSINQKNSQLFYLQLCKKYSCLQCLIIKSPTITRCVSDQQKKRKHNQKHFSLRLNQISKTIDTASLRQKQFRSYKSANREQDQKTRQGLQHNRWYSVYQGGQTKMVNLNFNPFPQAQRKHIYVGALPKGTTINRSKFISNISPARKDQGYDPQALAIQSQFQTAQRKYKSTNKSEMGSLKNRVMNNFNKRILQEESEGGSPQREQDLVWDIQIYQNDRDVRLPKIPNKASMDPRNFGVQVAIRRQYDRKYNLREVYHRKAVLRSSGLKMKQTIQR